MSNSNTTHQRVHVEGDIGGVPFSTPTEPVVALFYPLQDFLEPSTNTTYMAEGRYYLHEGNDQLAAVLVEWQKQGKVLVEIL